MIKWAIGFDIAYGWYVYIVCAWMKLILKFERNDKWYFLKIKVYFEEYIWINVEVGYLLKLTLWKISDMVSNFIKKIKIECWLAL